MARIGCTASVYDSAGHGALGYARHCSFNAKWNVDDKALCTIHKNAELKLRSRPDKIKCELLDSQTMHEAPKPELGDWVATISGTSYRIIQTSEGYVAEFRAEGDKRIIESPPFKSEWIAWRRAKKWAV